MRRSVGAGVGLWFLEVLGGTLGFLWPNLAGGFGSKVTLGNMESVAAFPAVRTPRWRTAHRRTSPRPARSCS
jgi:hypothetical protein